MEELCLNQGQSLRGATAPPSLPRASAACGMSRLNEAHTVQ